MERIIKMHEHSDYLRFLQGQANGYIKVLEELFGPCDPKFVFGSIQKSTHQSGMPQTFFPIGVHLNGNCVVDIQITEDPWDNCSIPQGAWQVAHECVHLLDPGSKGTNFLEEGLAVWFQQTPKFHTKIVNNYSSRVILPGNYQCAWKLVAKCMPQLITAVKEIRSNAVRIREISPERLAPFLPDVNKEKVEKLCTKFQ